MVRHREDEDSVRLGAVEHREAKSFHDHSARPGARRCARERKRERTRRGIFHGRRKARA